MFMVFWDVTPCNLAKRNLPCHAMKAHRKNTGTAPLISNPGTRGSWEGNLMPQQLYPRKEPWYPLKRRLDGSHSLPRSCDLQKNLLPMPRSEARFLASPIQSPYYTNWANPAPLIKAETLNSVRKPLIFTKLGHININTIKIHSINFGIRAPYS